MTGLDRVERELDGLRVEHGWSKRDLARRGGFGVHRILGRNRGVGHGTRLETASRMARALSLRLTALVQLSIECQPVECVVHRVVQHGVSYRVGRQRHTLYYHLASVEPVDPRSGGRRWLTAVERVDVTGTVPRVMQKGAE